MCGSWVFFRFFFRFFVFDNDDIVDVVVFMCFCGVYLVFHSSVSADWFERSSVQTRTIHKLCCLKILRIEKFQHRISSHICCCCYRFVHLNSKEHLLRIKRNLYESNVTSNLLLLFSAKADEIFQNICNHIASWKSVKETWFWFR